MLRIPETAKPVLSFTKVQQGGSEPYMQYIDQLCEALYKQIDNREAEGTLLQKLVVENTNTNCEKGATGSACEYNNSSDDRGV